MCGVCGTDAHIHEGEFMTKFPVSCLLSLPISLPLSHSMQLIPGHEAVGVVVDMGKNVTGFEKGDRCVADVGNTVSIPSTS